MDYVMNGKSFLVYGRLEDLDPYDDEEMFEIW